MNKHLIVCDYDLTLVDDYNAPNKELMRRFVYLTKEKTGLPLIVLTAGFATHENCDNNVSRPYEYLNSCDLNCVVNSFDQSQDVCIFGPLSYPNSSSDDEMYYKVHNGVSFPVLFHNNDIKCIQYLVDPTTRCKKMSMMYHMAMQKGYDVHILFLDDLPGHMIDGCDYHVADPFLSAKFTYFNVYPLESDDIDDRMEGMAVALDNSIKEFGKYVETVSNNVWRRY